MSGGGAGATGTSITNIRNTASAHWRGRLTIFIK
jgi:hypothetical protein